MCSFNLSIVLLYCIQSFDSSGNSNTCPPIAWKDPLNFGLLELLNTFLPRPPFWFSLPPHPPWPPSPTRPACPPLPLPMPWPESVISSELLLAMSGTGDDIYVVHLLSMVVQPAKSSRDKGIKPSPWPWCGTEWKLWQMLLVQYQFQSMPRNSH